MDRNEMMGRMRLILDGARSTNRELTDQERREFDKLEMDIRLIDIPETRGMAADNRERPEVEGRPNEELRSVADLDTWTQRAAENGVTVQSRGGVPRRVQHHSKEYLNEYWGQRMGLTRPGAELRALGEDTSSGSGAGAAVTPQSWSNQVILYLYPLTLLGRAGMHLVPMSTEIVNVPVQTAPVQPAWLAENSTIGLDANPAFSSLTLNSTGGFKDITNMSIEILSDAYVAGGLPDLLAQSAARNMALAVDSSGIVGVSGNAGNPGLLNETGFVSRGYTGSSTTAGIAPTNTTEVSIVNELIAQKNIPSEALAILSNNAVKGTLSRLNAPTYARYWDWPTDVQDLVTNRWYTSANANVVPTTEVASSGGAPGALTGGSLSSFYMGPFSTYCLFGSHLDLQTTVLKERYADVGQVGLFSFARWSIRWAHPETFVRTGAIITT